jgi:hypothetical protein
MRYWPSQFGQQKRQPTVGWLLLLSGLFCTWLSVRTYVDGQAHFKAATQQLNHAKQERQEALRQQAAQLLVPEPSYLSDKRWQRAATELTQPWLTTLSAIEQVTKPPVFLVSIKSDPQTKRIQLDAESNTLDAALTYVEGLQQITLLDQVLMLRHEDVQPLNSMGGSGVRFTVQSVWKVPQ